jgi:hypothetical protein
MRTKPATAAGLLLFFFAACSPPLRIVEQPGIVTVDVQTLGEYQTSVRRIRLSDDRHVVWEIAARDRVPQLHTVKLVAGENETTLPGIDGYAVVSPKADRFTLQRGHRYVVEVWGDSGRAARSAFTMP